MISNQRELYSLIDSVLKPHGYLKKGDTWYMHTDECICFFSIGKSPYAGRYDHVLGCFLKEIMQENEEFPKYYKNHLKQNIDEITGEKISKEIFDLESKKFVLNEREVAITDLFKNTVIPFLDIISTKKDIKRAINKYENLIYSVVVKLRESLGVSEPN